MNEKSVHDRLSYVAAALPPGATDLWVAVIAGRQAVDLFDALERAPHEVTIGKVSNGGAYPWFARCGEIACRGESLTDALGQLTTVLELL